MASGILCQCDGDLQLGKVRSQPMPETTELKVFITAGDDADARARAREREAQRRSEMDREYVDRFARRMRELFPRCPPGVDLAIAQHACLKYSGRVGRSAAAKAL